MLTRIRLPDKIPCNMCNFDNFVTGIMNISAQQEIISLHVVLKAALWKWPRSKSSDINWISKVTATICDVRKLGSTKFILVMFVFGGGEGRGDVLPISPGGVLFTLDRYPLGTGVEWCDTRLFIIRLTVCVRCGNICVSLREFWDFCPFLFRRI